MNADALAKKKQRRKRSHSSLGAQLGSGSAFAHI